MTDAEQSHTDEHRHILEVPGLEPQEIWHANHPKINGFHGHELNIDGSIKETPETGRRSSQPETGTAGTTVDPKGSSTAANPLPDLRPPVSKENFCATCILNTCGVVIVCSALTIFGSAAFIDALQKLFR